MLKRIPTPEEYELEKAYKALRLNINVGPYGYGYIPTMLLAAASSTTTTTATTPNKEKPTFRVRRPIEKERVAKALRLNGG
jgi:hypothetical protein